MFSGIVVILSIKADGGRSKPAVQALKLLLTAFIGLAVTSYLYSDLSGDHVCTRADTEEVLIGGMLGTFAVIMLVSLTWLITAFAPEKDSVLGFLRRMVCLASSFVVLLLAVSSQGTLSADLPYPSPLPGDVMIYVLGGIAVGFLVGEAVDWRIPLVPDRIEKLLATWAAGPQDQQDRGVSRCAVAALTYLAVNAVATSVVLGLSRAAWVPEQAPWTVYAAAWWALLAPLAVLGFAVRALARSDAAKAANQPAIDSGHSDAAPKAAVNLGQLLAAQGDTEAAKAAYQVAIDSGHSDAAPKAAFNLGVLLTAQGDTEAAKAAYRLAIDSGHRDVASVAIQPAHLPDRDTFTPHLRPRPSDP